MTIYNLGSINIDLVYRVDHFPVPGETLTSDDFSKGLGGKGANQSIAIARAGGDVRHIGAIGEDGRWALDIIAQSGADVRGVTLIDTPTGHAVINVDQAGENTIVLFAGANRALTETQISESLEGATAKDWLLLQNETSLGVFAARLAKSKGMKIAYSAAPFEAEHALEVLPLTDLIAVNEGEAAQLSQALGVDAKDIDVPQLLVTKGAHGVWYRDARGTYEQPVFSVAPLDTTGAGDTFLGYFLAALDGANPVQTALETATAASAIQITRHGAASAIPLRAEVQAFLRAKG